MTAAEPSVLRYAVRFRVVLKYGGQLAVVLACLTVVPLAVALGAGELSVAVRYLAVVAVLGAAGGGLARLRAPPQVQANEAIVIAASMFLVAPLAMAYPFMQAGLPLADALFEAVSGVTTTGLTATGTVEGMPASFLFCRAWMQWYGGLGIVVLLVALVMRPGRAAMGLAGIESDEGDLVGGTRTRARHALLVYGALTAAGAGLLWAAIGEPFEAVLLALASVSTGGFAPHDASLAALGGWPARAAVLALCFAGAVPLMLYRRAWSGAWRAVAGDVQLRALLLAAALVVVALAAAMQLAEGRPWPETLSAAALQGISAQTTAGFSGVDVSAMHPGPKLVLIASMFAGGGLGSTAGGIKILRLLILLRAIQIAILRTGLPRHAVLEPRLAGRRLDAADVHGALLVVLLFAGLVLASWAVFVLAGHDPLDSLFEVVSAAGTVGLSAGITGPELAPALKGVLCVDMLMGRLEVFALLIVLDPRTWIGHRASTP